MAVVSKKHLLEAGVHFGHQTRRWNPKMKRYIFTQRNGIYIIDLRKTLEKIEESYNWVKEMVAGGGELLFVGTKKQAQEAIQNAAERCEMPYVNNRWLGGMLTNWQTVKSRIDHMKALENMEESGEFEEMPKKEAMKLRHEMEKLHRNLNGIRDMKRVPEAIFVIDPKKERIPVSEARRLDIPIIGIVDTNCDPDEVDFVIPGNDDAIKTAKLISNIMASAVLDGLEIKGAAMQEKAEGEDSMDEAAADLSSEEQSQEKDSGGFMDFSD